MGWKKRVIHYATAQVPKQGQGYQGLYEVVSEHWKTSCGMNIGGMYLSDLTEDYDCITCADCLGADSLGLDILNRVEV